MTALQYAPDQALEAARGRGEPPWLLRARAEAARAFGIAPMPTPALRPWKYTDVTGLDMTKFDVDAHFAPSVEGVAPEGGTASTLSDALIGADHAALVERYLGSLIASTEGRFVAANSALWTRGAFVHAPRGKAFEGPVTVRLDVQHGAVFPRILVVAEPASEVTVVVRASSADAETFVSGVVEIIAEADATVRVLFDLDWGPQTQEFTTVRTRVGQNATVQVATLAIGGRLIKQTLEGLLEGQGATSLFRGVALGDSDQHFDFVTLQDHIAPRTVSDVQIKTALAGASRAVYYGVTRVEETASGASAEQANRNLLLSKHAKADSDPVLEILTNEVIRCGHAATVGPVDQEALFYLQSRGLDRRAALKLLVAGFFATVLDVLGDDSLAAEVAAKVDRKLSSAEL